jgi:taurine dioxygenase
VNAASKLSYCGKFQSMFSMKIRGTGQGLGALVTGANLADSLSPQDFSIILAALGEYGVLCFPQQNLAPENLRDFSARFGRLQVGVSGIHESGFPEISVLSNVVENGKAIGLPDAGQDWHTDMSYNPTIGFVNVLHALKVPHRDGRSLGDTLFANMHAAYEGLEADLKTRLAKFTATHDFNKFWLGMVRRPDSTRKPLTPEQRAKRPPSVHPVILTHPITGRPVLYCNPGYTVRINELDNADSERMLELLFAHQLQTKYQYRHQWTEGDVLVWDHIGTLHNALPDYAPHEHRLMKRCQVMADRIFDPAFVRASLEVR